MTSMGAERREGTEFGSASDAELLVCIADRLEEDEELLRSMEGFKRLPRFVRPGVQARFVHQLCKSPPLSDLDEAVARARTRCAEELKDPSADSGPSIAYSFEWDVNFEVDAERVGQIHCSLDVEFDVAQLRRCSLKTDEPSGGEGPPADLSLTMSVGAPEVTSGTPTLQYGPWNYPS